MLVIDVRWLNLQKEITISNSELVKAVCSMPNEDIIEILLGIEDGLVGNNMFLSRIFDLIRKVNASELTDFQKVLLKENYRKIIEKL